MLMTYKDNSTFDPAAFLAHAELGRRVAFGGAWTAPGHGHRDQRVHGA